METPAATTYTRISDDRREALAETEPRASECRPRVSIVSTESRRGIGGLAAYNRRLARELVASGVRVGSVARFDRPLPGPLDYAASQPGDEGASVDGLRTRLVRPARWAIPLLRRLLHLVGRPALRPIARAIFNAAYSASIRQAVPTGTDVVHYIGTGWELLGFAALRRARRIGAAFTCWPAVHAGTWGDSPLDVDLYNRCDAVFCQSDHERNHLIKLGVRPDRLVRAWLAPAVEPTGDGRRFRDRHGLGARPIVLFIARKVRSKGFHTLCEAMTLVRRTVPDAVLVAVGPDGEPPYPPLPPDAYLDLGPAHDALKADALAACDVFAMPSAAESFGIVYVEAWSYGKPVVGGPAEAVVELIDGSGAGTAVYHQEAGEVAAAVTAALVRRDQTSDVGERARELVRSRFNWSAVARIHLGTFQELLSRR